MNVIKLSLHGAVQQNQNQEGYCDHARIFSIIFRAVIFVALLFQKREETKATKKLSAD